MASKSLTQFIKFCIVGAIGTVIDMGVFTLILYTTSLNILIISTISFACAVVNNFMLNKAWTFKDKSRRRKTQFIKFAGVSLVSLAFRLPTLYVLVSYFSLWEPAANFIAILVATIVNFIGNKLWTFK